MAEHLSGFHIPLEIAVRNRGHATVGDDLVPEIAPGTFVGNSNVVRIHKHRLGISILLDASDKFPVARMAFQNTNLGGLIGRVEDLRIGHFNNMTVYQAFPAFFAPAGREPDGLGENLGEMHIEAMPDVSELVVFLFGETAGEIDHENIGPIMDDMVQEPVDPAGPPRMIRKRQTPVQAHPAFKNPDSDCSFLLHKTYKYTTKLLSL